MSRMSHAHDYDLTPDDRARCQTCGFTVPLDALTSASNMDAVVARKHATLRLRNRLYDVAQTALCNLATKNLRDAISRLTVALEAVGSDVFEDLAQEAQHHIGRAIAASLRVNRDEVFYNESPKENR